MTHLIKNFAKSESGAVTASTVSLLVGRGRQRTAAALASSGL